MNKAQYLEELHKKLRERHIEDPEEILEEYDAHFALKQRDGYSEEEIAARLGNPAEVASQYTGTNIARKPNILAKIGLVLLDIFASPFYAVLFLWVVVLGLVSFTFLLAGVALFLNQTSIPYMPLLSRFSLGFAMVALGVLAAMATRYCWQWLRQLTRVYVQWHKNIWQGQRHLLPPISPQLEPKQRRRMRSVTLVALGAFIVLFVASLLILFGAAGWGPFWHVWNWFG